MPETQRYAYRSFDRHWIIADGRLMSRPRPDLWRTHSDQQMYVTSLLTSHLGTGPALMACATIPDLHHFSGRGVKDTFPLYRTCGVSQANILPGFLDVLGGAYQRAVNSEDFLAYVYGVLAHPAFTARFADELEARDLRVPITQDVALFEQLRADQTALARVFLRTRCEVKTHVFLRGQMLRGVPLRACLRYVYRQSVATRLALAMSFPGIKTIISRSWLLTLHKAVNSGKRQPTPKSKNHEYVLDFIMYVKTYSRHDLDR